MSISHATCLFRHFVFERLVTPGTPPEINERGIYRATLRGAPWTSLGWSPRSEGFVFWFEAQRPQVPRVLYGSNAISELEDDMCKAVSMVLEKQTHSCSYDVLSLHLIFNFIVV